MFFLFLFNLLIYDFISGFSELQTFIYDFIPDISELQAFFFHYGFPLHLSFYQIFYEYEVCLLSRGCYSSHFLPFNFYYIYII